MMKLYYYLPNQSEYFSDPQVFKTDDPEEFARAIMVAKENGYKIVKVDTSNP